MKRKVTIPPHSHTFVEMYKKITAMANAGAKRSIIFLSAAFTIFQRVQRVHLQIRVERIFTGHQP